MPSDRTGTPKSDPEPLATNLPVGVRQTLFLDYVAAQAEERVFRLFDRFGDEPELFQEAHDMPVPCGAMNEIEVAEYLFVFCCGLVAPDWSWEISLKEGGKYQEVAVTDMTY